MVVLCRLGDSAMDLWLVVLSTGRIARHLLVGLHVAEFIQSTIFRLPARSGIRPANRSVNFLLLGHLPLCHAIFQGDNTTNLEQRW